LRWISVRADLALEHLAVPPALTPVVVSFVQPSTSHDLNNSRLIYALLPEEEAEFKLTEKQAVSEK
jgi:hypothetical protein